MTPSRLSDYLKQRGRASLAEVAIHFDVDPSAARGMLDMLIDKGRIRELSVGTCGDAGGCSCANERPLHMFEFVGRK